MRCVNACGGNGMGSSSSFPLRFLLLLPLLLPLLLFQNHDELDSRRGRLWVSLVGGGAGL